MEFSLGIIGRSQRRARKSNSCTTLRNPWTRFQFSYLQRTDWRSLKCSWRRFASPSWGQPYSFSIRYCLQTTRRILNLQYTLVCAKGSSWHSLVSESKYHLCRKAGKLARNDVWMRNKSDAGRTASTRRDQSTHHHSDWLIWELVGKSAPANRSIPSELKPQGEIFHPYSLSIGRLMRNRELRSLLERQYHTHYFGHTTSTW